MEILMLKWWLARTTLLFISIVVLCASSVSAATSEPKAASSNTADLFVATAIVDPVYEAIAPGFAEWMRVRAAEGGVAVVPGTSVRQSIAALRPGSATSTRDSSQFLSVAKQLGARNALLVDMRSRHGIIEADFRLYEVASGKLVDGGMVEAPLRMLVYETEQAMETIDRRIRLKPLRRSPAVLRSVDLAALSGAGRALRALDAQQLGNAWRDIAKETNPLSRRVAEQIDKMLALPTTSELQLAAVANARGDAMKAWEHIEDAAHAAYASPDGSVATLNTAGDTQVAIGGLRQARSFYKKALEVEPDNARATMGLAQILAVERKHNEARVAFEHAAVLDPESPLPLELAAEAATEDPSLRAQLLLKAGNRRAARFESKVAQTHFAKAIELDTAVEARAARRSGDLHAKVGEFDEALTQYERVRTTGTETPSLLVAEARSYEATGAKSEAVVRYETVLAKHDDVHSETLVALGDLHVSEGRAAEAVPLLESASAQEPRESKVNRSLARALSARNAANDRHRALELMSGTEMTGDWKPEELRSMAALQAETGDIDGATKSLERAIGVRELDPLAQQDIANLMNAQGDPEAASEWAKRFSHSGLNNDVEGEVETGRAEQQSYALRFEELDQLVASFGANDERVMVTVFEGLREPMDLENRALDWLMPRTSNEAALELALHQALEASYVVSAPLKIGENFAREVENLFLFDEKSSLNVGTITDLNIAYDADAIFLARLVRMPADVQAPDGSCWRTPHFILQMRRLSGKTDGSAQVLSNQSCLAGGVDGEFGMQNNKAAAPYGVLFILVLFPFVRGWGRLEVDFVLPEGSAAMFAASLTRRPSKVRDRSNKTKAAATSVFRNRLRKVSRSEHRLVGTHMSFKWVPARRSHYYLTIRGPLVDLATNSLIGEFLEERVVTIDRGKMTRFDFDLRTREAMVTIVVSAGAEKITRARVARRGVPTSTRFCPEGKGAIYVPEGEHILVVGVDGRVAEQSLRIKGVAPITLDFDMNANCVFEDCEAAVEPYLEADYATASRALEEAGQASVAVEVARLRTTNSTPANVVEPAVAGISTAASPEETLLSRSPEAAAKAAQVHDEAGEYALAAEAYRELRDLVNAARCYEEVYDWPNALECYQDLGDTENVLLLLERSGELYEAGILAAESGQHDRAIHDLQQVDSRHPRYSETCRKLAEILSDKGEPDLAVEKFDEGLQISGTSEVSLETLKTYAELLERAERLEEALGVYEGIRRRDVHFEGVNTCIEHLRKQLSQPVVSDDARTIVSAKKQPAVESRYEIQGELGRGGMGIVYRALDKHLQRTVALKVLPEHLREHEAALELFLREARSAAALNHRNIVTVYDAGQEGEMDFISMECLEGSGLDAILKQRGALSSRMVASVGLQVASGLDYAQKCKIIHRDIKPSNLFITSERIVKIMDFGLAKMVEEVRRASTIIGGTPNYMAPEQAVGSATDHRADLYALGGTLFHLVTGSVPFESGDVTYQHAHSPTPDPREREMSVEAPMANLIMRLMAKAPEDRLQSARDVAVELTAFLKTSG